MVTRRLLLRGFITNEGQVDKGGTGAGSKIDILEASDNLPDPDVIALELVEDLEAALRL